MPYITQDRRKVLGDPMNMPTTPGELNYCVTRLMATYLDKYGLSYGTINEIIGAVESAKAEFQRRVVAPYEDVKISVNGDVYGPF